ncbi:hypothetical protein M408DRAFT_163718 [Serendipita vermifera MAFF 305830]|uniref:Uncharacterized protein n=1 Tax=Serendipita vermifera MAFF 305830 TaxID=933852 RepID=A0A0C3B6H0_SERVB|nr:hypothetical protein M408DRAFT_163718 [Serendipita vermifera MAFF 305830]
MLPPPYRNLLSSKPRARADTDPPRFDQETHHISTRRQNLKREGTKILFFCLSHARFHKAGKLGCELCSRRHRVCALTSRPRRRHIKLGFRLDYGGFSR